MFMLRHVNPTTENFIDYVRSYFSDNRDSINEVQKVTRQTMEQGVHSGIIVGEVISSSIETRTRNTLHAGYHLPQNTATTVVDNIVRPVLYGREAVTESGFQVNNLADQGSVTNSVLALVSARTVNQQVDKYRTDVVKNRKAKVAIKTAQVVAKTGVCAHIFETFCCFCGSSKKKVNDMLQQAKDREV